MKIAQQGTAVACYHDHVIRHLAKPQYDLILGAMREDRDYSLSELSVLTGIQNSTLAARINELRAANRLETSAKRRCSVTQITILPSRLPVRGQLRLIGK